jgi:hypothetical protein
MKSITKASRINTTLQVIQHMNGTGWKIGASSENHTQNPVFCLFSTHKAAGDIKIGSLSNYVIPVKINRYTDGLIN